jgi:hypothetical protein
MADKIIWDYTEDTTPARTDNILLQPGISDVYTRAQISNILSQIIAADIPDISSTYATQTDIANFVTETDQSNIYYVGKHGNNSNDGLTIENAFLTFSAAMSAASSGDAIVCFDNGNYAEGLTVKDGVNVFAPNATLTVTGSQLSMGDASVIFNKVQRASGGNAMILFEATTGRQILTVDTIEDNGSGIGMRFTSASIPIVHFRLLYVNGGGTGIADFTGAIHYHVTGDDLYLNSDNAVGIHQSVAGENGVATIQHILELGTRTSTVALDIDAGSVYLICNEIVADTAWDIASGASLNIVGCTASGTKTNAGTLNKFIADDREQTYSASVFLESPSDKDYRLLLNIPKAITITKVTTRSVSGTCTATVKINTTALGGTANSVSSTEDVQTHSTSNTASAGDDIVLTVSANSSCEDMSLTIEYTEDLD